MSLEALTQFEQRENYVPKCSESSLQGADELRYIDAVRAKRELGSDQKALFVNFSDEKIYKKCSGLGQNPRPFSMKKNYKQSRTNSVNYANDGLEVPIRFC